MKIISKLAVFLFLISCLATTAQKPITLEDIWTNYTFYPRYVAGFNFMNDGRHYTKLEDNIIKKYDLLTGDYVLDIVDGASMGDNGQDIGGYVFSDDEQRIIFSNNREAIYRHSFKANYYLYDLKTKQLTDIFPDGKISYATLSPDNKHIAFTHDNNLYSRNLASGTITQITKDGEYNKIINGSPDWVYEEEFSFAKAFYWSPDSKKIAFIRFDESEVKEFTMQLYKDEMYPENVTFKYPKVGEDNAKVSAHIYHLDSKKTINADMGDMHDMYIPRLKWTQDPNELCAFKMNRHQNHLDLLLINAKDGKAKTLLTEKNKYYVDIHDNLRFLKNGKEFVWTSEKDGYNHIYLYGMDGKEKRLLTPGNYDITRVYGVDEKNKKVYFQAAEVSPMEKHVFEVGLNKGKPKKLYKKAGSSSAQFSSTYDYYVLNHSTINQPTTYAVYDRKGKLVRALEDNAKLKERQKEFGTVQAQFFQFTTSEGVKLNGWKMEPKNMEPGKKHPVLITQYSGPNSQSVTDAWKGNNYWWFQMLVQEGFIVVCVDPRGTGARGEEFRKMTYLQMGKYETLDMIETAKYLAKQPEVDGDNIGIFGWSYGGYMSSLAITKGADVFQAAIAVAPVTSWKWYDTIYTERFMRTLAENEDGYKDNSPIYFADMLKGDYLLIHGNADDNVHFQHAAEMSRALIAANKQFDTYYYPNRNHGIYGNNARIHLYTKMTNFLKESLQSKD